MSKPLEITIGQYLRSPDTCPYCGSEEITGGDFEPESTWAFRKVHCNTCENKWNEVYLLTSIILEDEPPSIN